MGIDKGNTTEDVLLFDELYGIEYPSVSGQDGGGNAVHWTYEIQATPTVIVITPDKLIATHQIFPPNTPNVVDSVVAAGGILQSCTTDIPWHERKDKLLTLGPNPSQGPTNLTLQVDMKRNLEIVILSITGQKIAHFKKLDYGPGSHVLKADLSAFQDGFYFVQVKENDQNIYTSKLILLR